MLARQLEDEMKVRSSDGPIHLLSLSANARSRPATSAPLNF